MLSITNQADAVEQMAGGPVVGLIGTVFSLRAALVVTGVILTPALGLYAKVSVQGSQFRVHGYKQKL